MKYILDEYPVSWPNRIMRKNLHHSLVSVLAVAAGLLAPTLVLAQTDTPADPQKAPPGCGPRVIVEYTDDDPDYFFIKNRSPEGWTLVKLGIELTRTHGDLVFDTDEGGPGIGGAAGFYAGETSHVRLTGSVPAQDGGKTIALSFEGFAPGLDFHFSVDLDALARDGGTTWVLPQDMKDGRVIATFTGPSGNEDKVDAIFNENAEADSGAGGCV